jgi:dihydrodipicolinate reductase
VLSDGAWMTAPAVAAMIVKREPSADEATTALRVLKGLKAAGIVASRAGDLVGEKKVLWGMTEEGYRG